MNNKMTNLNIRITEEEKSKIKELAEENNQNISAYSREKLLSNSDDTDKTNVLQEKDERITDLKNQIAEYQKQIEQLHTIVLATQKDNQLLLEQKKKFWWQFWK